MKPLGLTLLFITTLLLIMVIILSGINSSFNLIFCLTVSGQLLFVYTVYKILTDDYTTDKTFNDYYEDHPINSYD